MTPRRLSAVLVAAVLALTLALPTAVLADSKSKGKSEARGPAVKGKLTVEGTVTAINSAAGSFTLQITKPGHQKRAGGSSITVLVQQATMLKVRGARDDDDDDNDDEGGPRRPATIADVRVGDRVQVQGFRLDDGRVLALRLDVKNRAVAGGTPSADAGLAVASGVVTAKAANSLIVVGSDGRQRIVLVGPGTGIRGQRASFGEIQPSDVINVQGTVNADGTIAARSIEVTSTAGTVMTGLITAKAPLGTQFLILNGLLAVNVSGDTRILSGGQLRSFGDLQVGQTITVSGTPITVGGVTVGINARLITF